MSEPTAPDVMYGNVVGTDIGLVWGTVGGSTLARLDIRNGDFNLIGRSPFITFDEYTTVRQMLLRYKESHVYKGKTLSYWKNLYETNVAQLVAQKCALWILTPVEEDGFGSKIPYLEDIVRLDDIATIVKVYVHDALRFEPSIESVDIVSVSISEDDEILQIDVAVTARYIDRQILVQLNTRT